MRLEQAETGQKVVQFTDLQVMIVMMMMMMKNAVFWGVAPCRCGRLNRRFGGSYRFHLQG
jgi:hypothetical protein